ncbi:MAG: F0F1 ATP synthase subunit B [Acholeplasmataceae bacterium]|nr:F0F1 ATP synthase subunit B [Acholeplasmataceae bacterium]
MKEIFQDATRAIQEGLNSVFKEPHIVLLNIIAFFILVFFIRKFLWVKITDFLEQRQLALTESLAKADAERARAKELQEKSVSDYEAMKEETRQLKEKLTLEAYKQQEELITNAKKEAKQRFEQAKKDIEYEIAQANEDIKQAIKEVAFAAAEKIVKREIDESLHQDIIDEIIAERTK